MIRLAVPGRPAGLDVFAARFNRFGESAAAVARSRGATDKEEDEEADDRRAQDPRR